jgi:ABC-type glycerol-3-phosphate transport system substrate-binding protein
MNLLRKISLFAVIAAASLLSACATINSLSSTAGVVENTTIEFSVAEYIQHAGAAPAQLVRAQKVKAIAIEIQGLDNGTVTVAQLEAAVAADIAKLQPAEQILATGLMQIIVANLGTQVNSGLLNAASTAVINTVMGDIITACTRFGA